VIVVDASVVVKWFVKETGHSLALGLIERELELYARDLILVESANVLWKKLKMGEVTKEQAEDACALMSDFFSQIVPSRFLLGPAFGFAQFLDHPVYDCLYLACAERLGAKLVTGDDRFAGKAKSAGLGHLVVSLEEAASFGPTKGNG
jgi:predicted nucleic acid-binding protein